MLVLEVDEESTPVPRLMVSHSHFWVNVRQGVIMLVSPGSADTLKTLLLKKCESCAQRNKNTASNTWESSELLRKKVPYEGKTLGVD